MTRIQTVLLLGGGDLLWGYLTVLKKTNPNVAVIVLSSPRHLEAPIESVGVMRDALRVTQTRYEELDTLDPAALQRLKIDLSTAVAISFAAPWVVKQDVIDMLGGRVYNLHGTRLPQDRGGASFSWQIMRGNNYGFAVIHRIDAGIDTGDIIDFHEFLYDGCRTPQDHYRRYVAESLKLLERITPALLAGADLPRLAQPPYFSSYWPRLNTEVHGWVDWTWSGTDIARFVTAFDDPYDGVRTFLDDQIVSLKDVTLDTGDGLFHPFQAGLIYRTTKEYVAACTTTGTLLIRRIADDEGRLISHMDIKLGSRLWTPIEKLEEAKRTRVIYTPVGVRESRK